MKKNKKQLVHIKVGVTKNASKSIEALRKLLEKSGLKKDFNFLITGRDVEISVLN